MNNPDGSQHPAASATLGHYTNQQFWPASDARLLPLMQQTLTGHGDALGWEASIAALPRIANARLLAPTRSAQGACRPIGLQGALADGNPSALEAALRGLHPWRKGPWEVAGLHIDTEWRSDWKWQRLAPYLPDLTGQRVLDVGCGNGYYGWHMLNAGAREVVGIDPTALFFYQHLAMARYLAPLYPEARNQLLPIKLEDLGPADDDHTAANTPSANDRHTFDSVFSMGVLYHRRDALAHLRELRAQLKPGGTLVLETLVCETTDLEPNGRYARMRNVHLVPRPATISGWLQHLGFQHCDACDVTPTSQAEQRSTRWMTFESLEQSLDSTRPDLTVEGHPAPVRACFVANWAG